jgi:hypothetical protein
MFPTFTAFFTMLSEACKSLTTHKEKQLETDVLKTKKKKTKAVEYAEKLIFHVDDNYPVKEDNTYQKLRKNFFKNN